MSNERDIVERLMVAAANVVNDPRDRLAIRDAAATIELLRKRLADKADRAERYAHLLIECGVIPGVSRALCRCDECRKTAREMDDAGWLEHTKDRWWATDAAGALGKEAEHG